MRYAFDDYGWYAGEVQDGPRTTGLNPDFSGDRVVGQPYPNFTGVEWVLANYSEPPPPDLRPIRRAEIFAELAKIDADTTKPRTLRELSLGIQSTIDWVQTQDAKAVALRADLSTL